MRLQLFADVKLALNFKDFYSFGSLISSSNEIENKLILM